MIWMTAEDLVKIHSVVIAKSGGMDGLRDRGALEGALAAPEQSFGGQELYPGELEKIARLGYGLVANHPFVDGNKRIGAMATQLMLRWNGYALQLQPGELAETFIALAAGTKGYEQLLHWLQAHRA